MRSMRSMVPRRGFLVAATAIASLGFASAASAATYTVNDTRDLPQSTTASAGQCVSTASPATCTLRAAIQAANENGGANTINVPAGTYGLTASASNSNPLDCLSTAGLAEDQSFGSLKVNPCNNSTQITIVGAGIHDTVINAEGHDRIFEVWLNGALDAQQMTLENGSGTGSNTTDIPNGYGGAINSAGHLSAESVDFTGNSAGTFGGAIDDGNFSGSTLSVSGSVFQNDTTVHGGGAIATNAPNDSMISFSLFQADSSSGTAGGNGGGAIIVGGAGSSLTLSFDDLTQNVAARNGGALLWNGGGALNIGQSLFNQNQATGQEGGAIYISTQSNVTASNTSFAGNTATTYGGAISDEGSQSLNLAQDLFSANTATNDEGGALGLFSGNSTGTTLTSDEFDHNSATNSSDGFGGAIEWAGGPLSSNGSSFVDNVAVSGGALDVSNNQLLKLVNTTMSHNTAPTGGAIYGCFIPKGTCVAIPVTLINDTIAFNNASAGGGAGVIDGNTWTAGGSASTGFGVQNTTIAENSGGDCGQDIGPGTPTTFSNSVDLGNNNDSDQTCFGGLGGPNDLVGVNPLLSNAANNGGPTIGGPGATETLQTDAEQANSPTVDAGNNNGCPSVDARGVSRPQGKACDIGAFEFGSTPGAPTTTTTGAVPPPVTTTTTTTKPKPKPKPKPKVSGHPQLVHNLLQVSDGKVSVTLKCSSSKACKGRLNLIKHAFARVKGRRKLVTLRCTFRHFSIGASKTATLTSKVSGGCLRLLKHAKHHRIIVRLNVLMTSGQRGIKGKNVILHQR